MALLWVRATAAPPRYIHTTDALLKPGDVILPAAQRGHSSRHRDVPGYDPTKVYMHDTHHENYDGVSNGSLGAHDYGVEPIGEVGPDPEVEHWKQHYRNDPDWHEGFGLPKDEAGEWDDEHLGTALSHVTAPAARVVSHECCS